MTAPVRPHLPESTEASREAHREQRAAAYPPDDARLAELRDALAARLREAGVALPAAEFDPLVLDMARFALRWTSAETDTRDVDRGRG
jgi:hypothetical protein